MTKYVLEADLSDGCWNCPCEGEGCCCQAAEYRTTIPDDAGELPDDYRPEWCPLVDFEQALANRMYENSSAQPESDEDVWDMRIELYESEWEMLGELSVYYGLTTAQTIAKLVREACAKVDGHMTYDEFSDRASVVANVRPEDGMLVVGVTIGAVFKPMRGPCETDIPEDEYVEMCKRRFYEMLFGSGDQCI